MISSLKKVNIIVERAEILLIITIMLGLTLILSSQVVLRYLFNSPIFWAEEVASQLLISLSFIGISILISKKDLVRVDIIIQNIPKHFKKLFLILLDLIALITIIIICYFSTKWISRAEVRMELSPTTGLPQWYNYIVLVTATYLMLWHQAYNLLLALVSLKANKKVYDIPHSKNKED